VTDSAQDCWGLEKKGDVSSKRTIMGLKLGVLHTRKSGLCL